MTPAMHVPVRDSECQAQAGTHLVGPLHDLAGVGRDLLDKKGEEGDGHYVLLAPPACE